MASVSFIFLSSTSFDEDHICLLMIHSWLMKVLLWFSHKRYHRTRASSTAPSPVLHVFSPPLHLSMLRKVRCRVQRSTSTKALLTLPICSDAVHAKSNAVRWNTSQNCVDTSSATRCKQNASLVAIDIDDHRHPRGTVRLDRRNSTVAISLISTTQNSNSVGNESLMSSATTLGTPSSDSESSPSIQRKHDKTWRLQIQDDLNKDGSRHNVIHKGDEESVRKRRNHKRAQRSEEKKRRIEEKVSNANQRWQKYSNVDYELVFFISRYFDQLPLCSDCRNYFVTHRAQFLSEDPRASLDYAADTALRSASTKTLTLKQAAKARLIRDYDKQTDVIFNLCDNCLNTCTRIRNDLKEINTAQKISSGSPVIDTRTLNTPDLPTEPMLSPPSPFIANESPSHRPTVPDLHQLYMSNLLQYHQLKLQQLYEQSQVLLVDQHTYAPLIDQQQRLNKEFQACASEMRYHCLEALHLQYPGYALSFPYLPFYHPRYLSYRDEELDDQTMNHECSASLSQGDDRLTIDTCHGLIEYRHAPLDDFMRGLEVLQCLSTLHSRPQEKSED